MATIADRIKEAMELRGMKQADLVSLTGIGKSSISTYLSGEYEPKQRNIYKIAKVLDVNEAWLMGEDVPMERFDYSDFMASYANEIKSGRVPAKEDMFRLFGKEHTAADIHKVGDKTAVLYYKAMDHYAAPEMLELIAAVDELDYHALENIRALVQAYLRADAPIREIVDTALKPYRQEDILSEEIG